MQHDPMDPNFNDEALEPDGWMWVRGVDYVAGWRSAADAATELKGAMDEAGIDTARSCRWHQQQRMVRGYSGCRFPCRLR
ncbi:hypothetical protein ACGFSD_10655 [Streptomyces caniferus]|uniref:hypothetical protein n=1 Tax=Streptomyces caniferus TaxID=285557 RepID=UPI0037239108